MSRPMSPSDHQAGMRSRSIASALTFLIALFNASCAGGDSAREPAATRTVGPYEQTWTQSYGETDCREWRVEMNSHERYVAAADMLLAARRADGAGDLPPESMIRSFEMAIGQACAADTEGAVSIAEVAAGIYTLSTDFAP